MLFMQKEKNMSEYIDFITYQDDTIIQRPLPPITFVVPYLSKVYLL